MDNASPNKGAVEAVADDARRRNQSIDVLRLETSAFLLGAFKAAVFRTSSAEPCAPSAYALLQHTSVLEAPLFRKVGAWPCEVVPLSVGSLGCKAGPADCAKLAVPCDEPASTSSSRGLSPARVRRVESKARPPDVPAGEDHQT